MKLKADLFPYPVLSRELDDYIDSDFYTDISYKKVSPSKVELHIDFTLENDILNQLIQNQKAVYAVHVEGVSSAYRQLYTLGTNNSSIDIPLSSDTVGHKLDINTMIIAKEAFESYTNPNFNPDYYEDNYSIETVYKGDILAFDTMVELNIDFSNKENPNAKSMIRVAAKNQNYMSVDTDGEVIQVYLPKKAHTAYLNLSKSNEAKKNMLLVTVILPALSEVINRIKYGDVEIEREWFVALTSLLEKLNYNELSLKNADSLKVAQELLDLPMENALYNFYQWEEQSNE